LSEQPIYYIGVDFGQKKDHTAVCVVEHNPEKAIVRFIWKFPLGTPLKMVADKVTELYQSVSLKGQVYGFTCDATGMGVWPAEMIQERLPEIRVENFIFTNKTKRELVGKVKVLHALGRLRFATRRGDELYNRQLAELMTEMRQLQAKVIREDSDNPEIEVFKTGAHDDMFTALALAVKDIRFDTDSIANVAFVKDDSYVRTPLDDTSQMPVIAFF
jgi:phage FluMu gp28-like protein